jgi:UDP-GlcNAc:undecaprenyl-phosphate GlcNAc-1-phosphate transferase
LKEYLRAMLLTIVWPFLVSMLIAVIAIPAIIKVADAKHLMDEPDSDRKIHSNRTPTLGGIAIFAGTVFSFSFFSDYLNASSDIKFMTSALILLFFAGIKDDILLLTPMKKLTIQIISALLITLMGKLYLTSLWGAFAVTEIPPFVGIGITLITIVALINAFNLIDGVNGLAGGLGFIATLFFGTWFYLTNSSSLSILSFALAGALAGFLFFNFHRGKIFMGDTGSMLIGFIISILLIKFVENNRIPGVENSSYYIKAAPAVGLSAILIPLFDLSRVFFQRILKRRNPFSADRWHIHHVLLDLGLSHTKISITLYALTLIFLGVALGLSHLRSMTLIIVLTSLAALFSLFAISLKRRKKRFRDN